MPRVRISTTVDSELLTQARSLEHPNDSSLVEEALRALIARHRAVVHDAAYAAYERLPPESPDQWGDLASWRDAAAST